MPEPRAGQVDIKHQSEPAADEITLYFCVLNVR